MRIDSVLYETKGSGASATLTGVSTTIPIMHASEEYPGGAFIANVVVDRQKQRVNLFLFGPTDAVATRIDILDDHLNLLQTKILNAGTNGMMTVVTDLLSGVPDPCCAAPKPLPDAGAFNITVGRFAVGDPRLPDPTAILSVVDNGTNDSTIFAPSQVLFTKNAATLP